MVTCNILAPAKAQDLMIRPYHKAHAVVSAVLTSKFPSYDMQFFPLASKLHSPSQIVTVLSGINDLDLKVLT